MWDLETLQKINQMTPEEFSDWKSKLHTPRRPFKIVICGDPGWCWWEIQSTEDGKIVCESNTGEVLKTRDAALKSAQDFCYKLGSPVGIEGIE